MRIEKIALAIIVLGVGCGPSEAERHAEAERQAQRLDTKNDAAPESVHEALRAIDARTCSIMAAMATISEIPRCEPSGEGPRRLAPLVVSSVLDHIANPRPWESLGLPFLFLSLDQRPVVPYSRVGDPAFHKIANYRAVALYDRRTDNIEMPYEHRQSTRRLRARESIATAVTALAETPTWVVFHPTEIVEPLRIDQGFIQTPRLLGGQPAEIEGPRAIHPRLAPGHLSGRVLVFEGTSIRCGVHVTATNSENYHSEYPRIDLADRTRLAIQTALRSTTLDIDIGYGSGELGGPVERIAY